MDRSSTPRRSFCQALRDVSEEVVTLTAEFAGLHDVARVLAEHVRFETGIADVQVGPPQEDVASQEPGVRITLLYTTPSPAARNEPGPPGPGMQPSPLRLSCFYLVSASGSLDGDPFGAHNALGQVLRLYHEFPVLQLPLAASGTSRPGSLAQLGKGQLRVTQVTSTMEQMVQIWLALRQRLQPCAVFEVEPVELVRSQPKPRAPHPSR